MLKNNLKHQIQKFTFDVGFDTEENAFQFQADFSSFIKEEILPLTEAILDKYGKNKYIRINKLELDLGDIFHESYKEDFYQKFKERFSDKLRLILAGYDIHSPYEKPEVVSLAKSQYQALLYFFQTGLLSWNVPEANTSGYINRQLLELIESSEAKARQFLKEVFIVPSYRLRFIRQIDDVILWKAIHLYYESDIEWIKKDLGEIITFYSGNTFSRFTTVEFKEIVLEFVIEQIAHKKLRKREEKIFSPSLLKFIAVRTGVSTESIISQLILSSGLKVARVKGKIVVNEIYVAKDKPVPDSFVIKAVTKLLHEEKLDVEKFDKEIITQAEYSRSESTAEFVLDEKNNMAPREQQDSPVKNLPVKNKSEQQNYINTLVLQRISAVLSLLKKYYTLSVQYSMSNVSGLDIKELKVIQEIDVKELDIYIKEIISFNPSLLKRIFADSLFEIENYTHQQLLAVLDITTRKTILQQAFSIDEGDFISIIKTAEERLVKDFFTIGIMDAALGKKYASKKQITSLLESYLKEKSFITEVSKAVRTLSKDSIKQLIMKWSRYIEADKIKKYFKDIDGTAFDFKALEDAVKKESAIKTEFDYFNSLKIESLSFESVLTLLEEAVKEEKAIRKNSKIIVKLINILISKNESQIIRFLMTLADNKYSALRALLPQTIIGEIEEGRKNRIHELENLIQEKKKVEEIAEKIKEIREEQEQQKLQEEQTILPTVNMGEPVYITNSGIVILHPYLSMLFKKLELLDKKEFKDEYSLHKAVHLLQYLANKAEKAEEYELVLNKILCGMELSEPVRRDIELTEEEKTICESLLEALIQNWTILKKTSPDNLRSSFFIRDGRLLLESQGWKLRVEEKGYDILVEKLPWSIAMVKLPWMKNIIYVEWR